MKNTLLKIATLIVILLAVNTTSAQINRTINTKVADILAQLPTKNLDHSNKLMGDIIDLDSEGILLFCDMLVPPGTGDDTQARYAINSLATFVGGEGNEVKENLVEKSLLIALQRASNIEIKTFLINRLTFCGSNTSLVDLTKYLSNSELYNVALSTITSIGTKEAASSILKEAKNSNNVILPSLITSLGNLRYTPAIDFIQGLANSDSSLIKEKALTALAIIPPLYPHLLLWMLHLLQFHLVRMLVLVALAVIQRLLPEQLPLLLRELLPLVQIYLFDRKL